MKIKDGFYFLCPKCHKLTKNMVEWVNKTIKQEVTINDKGEPSYEDDLPEDVELLETRCKECKNVVAETWEATQFLVKVENGRIIAWGDYWTENPEEFNEVVNEILEKENL